MLGSPALSAHAGEAEAEAGHRFSMDNLEVSGRWMQRSFCACRMSFFVQADHSALSDFKDRCCAPVSIK